jgi:hypothetical protein
VGGPLGDGWGGGGGWKGRGYCEGGGRGMNMGLERGEGRGGIGISGIVWRRVGNSLDGKRKKIKA